MKKQIRRISKGVVWLMGFVLISGILYPHQAIAQTSASAAQKNDSWELNYKVHVWGDFSIEPELGSGDSTVRYKIDREYEGKSKLIFNKESGSRFEFLDLSTTEVYIKINDERTTYGDPVCQEYSNVKETWKGETSTSLGNPKYHPSSQLIIDNEKKIYKTSFHLFHAPNYKQYDIDYEKEETVKTSTGGGGDDPVKNIIKSPVQHLSIDGFFVPNVTDFIKDTRIIHTFTWSEVKERESNFTWVSHVSRLAMPGRMVWVSDTLHPDEPLFKGVPETKDKVDIIITYAIKKVKG